jgi:enamine deaminase RidA (YjgF/YER057c/UK114 family)
MLNRYNVILPEVQGNAEEERRQCLEKVRMFHADDLRLIKLNIFADLPDFETYVRFYQETGTTLKDAFGDQCPAYTVTVHPPEKPWKVSVEAGYLSTDSSDINFKVWNKVPYVVCATDSGKEIWAGGLGTGVEPFDTRRAAKAAFDQMRAVLYSEDMSFNHIVRQWNYIGNILEVKNNTQNYQIFNEVRSEYYHKYRGVHGYPAATGVGMKHGGVVLDFYAFKSEKSVKLKSVENPDQVNSYEYGQQVLKGVQPPQFERAVLVSGTQNSTLFVSGTASILGQDTVGLEDVKKQTEVTLENIAKLTDLNKVVKMSGNSESANWNLILLRVYIKKQTDFALVKSICLEKFPGITAICIEADICRDNLLVEIEAEFSRRELFI